MDTCPEEKVISIESNPDLCDLIVNEYVAKGDRTHRDLGKARY